VSLLYYGGNRESRVDCGSYCGQGWKNSGSSATIEKRCAGFIVQPVGEIDQGFYEISIGFGAEMDKALDIKQLQ